MTFYILAAAVPLILLSTVLRGVLEAGQRFGLINIAQMSAGPLLFILPLLGLSLGVGLVGIIAFLVVVRLLFAVLFLLMCLRAFPPVRGRARLDRNLIKPLFSFGGWLTISNVAGLILLYLDRFIIGSLISVSALAYYVVPWEMLIRLMVFPSSVTTVLFPAFSATKVISQDLIARLYSRSIKYLLVVMAPILFLMILFAADILRLWLGSDYAAKCSTVLQILAIGMTFTPFQVSLSLIQGMGRPDVIARFYVAELVLYLPLASFMATRYGIEGVAVAWTIRAGIDTVLLLWASVRMFNLRWRAMAENGLIRGVLAVALLGGAFGAMLHAEMSVATRILAASVCVAFFMIVSWRLVMDPRDREFLGFGTLR
jgi:O-antigen/teichoic acid export membrane protein